MAWVACDKNGGEYIYEFKPYKGKKEYISPEWDEKDLFVELPKGSIKKLIGRDLRWEDEPVELN